MSTAHAIRKTLALPTPTPALESDVRFYNDKFYVCDGSAWNEVSLGSGGGGGVEPSNTPGTADNPVTNGGDGNFPLELVYTNGVAKWEKRPKVYVAILTQSGTNNPTAVVVENSLGGEPALVRTDAGTYEVRAVAGTVPKDKSVLFIGSQTDDNRSSGLINFQPYSDDLLGILTRDLAGVLSDDGLGHTAIRIEVFP